jgi:hypothetical protein
MVVATAAAQAVAEAAHQTQAVVIKECKADRAGQQVSPTR